VNDLDHLAGRLSAVQIHQPLRQHMRPGGQLTADPAVQHRIAGELGDHGQHCGGLRQVNLQEAPHQLIPGRALPLQPERASAVRIQRGQQRAHQPQQSKRIIVGHSRRDFPHQIRRTSPRPWRR